MAKNEISEKLDKLIEYVTFGLKKDLREDFLTKKGFEFYYQQNDKNFKNIDKNMQDFDRRFSDILKILDNHTVILKRLDQERIFT